MEIVLAEIPSLLVDSSDLANNKTFSACLLTMDDNHRLVEWLAYHHHVLPLEHLIVTVDPRSTTSPTALFDRWRARGMIIEEWSDNDFMSQDNLKYSERVHSLSQEQQFNLHRDRQCEFLAHCMKHLKKKNRTWTLLVDSDEYLQFNGPAGEKKP